MRRSISRQLSLVQLGVVGFSLALALALMAWYQSRASSERMRSDLASSSAAFSTLIEPSLWNVDLVGAQVVATTFARDPRIARITFREVTTDSSFTVESVQTADTVMRTVDVWRGNQVLGTFSLSLDRAFYRAQLRDQAVGSLIVMLIALAATLLSVQLVFRRLLSRPLDDLSRIVSGYASGTHHASAGSIRYTEFLQLTEVLDSMSNRIREQLAELASTNRELGALNRFLVTASTDPEPSLLLAEAGRELRALFDATQARARLVRPDGTTQLVLESPAESSEQVLSAASVDIPIVVNGERAGSLAIARGQDRPFTTAEVELAGTLAAQVAAAITRYRARDAERLLRAAIEQLPDCVLLTDAAGVVVYVNPAFTTLSGHEAAEVLGRPSWHLARLREEQGDAASGSRDSLSARLTSRRKDGTEFIEDVGITPVRSAGGAITHYVVVARDVSTEVQREAQLRHAQRMEGVGQLAGGVAHDFNNMLGAILMQLELIELDEQLTPSLRRETEEMREALQRAANLTRQLLMFSRRQAMHVLPHDLNTVTADVLRLLRRTLGEEIHIAFNSAPGPLMLDGDMSMIEQVILNLCVNARDAMPSGGRLTITTRRTVRAAGEPHEGAWVCVEVADTGIGMSKQTMSRIFEPFFTTKEAGKGTGLGLATTHGIVEQHGGWIDVTSEPGAGTTFRVYFPALAYETNDAPKPAYVPMRKGNASILVVEDEASVRQMVGRALRRLGYRVLEAGTGREALRVFNTEGDTISLVLTDMVMPDGIDGVQLVEQLRATNPALRAIVMSGYSAQLNARAIPSDVAYLAKPFSMAALSMAVEDGLRVVVPQ